MMLNKWVCGIGFAICLLAASESDAACTISTTSVNFGPYNVFNAAPTDSTGTITFKCGILDFNITVALSPGQSGVYTARTMRLGSESLPYNLYRDAARTAVWGNGTSGTQQYSNTWPIGQTIVLTVYGRIFPSADVGAGTYTDTVSAVVNF